MSESDEGHRRMGVQGTALQFRILGPLDVVNGSKSIMLDALKPRILLAVLLSEANEPVSVDRLIDALWSNETPPSATDNLRAYVYQLRRALGDRNRIERRSPGYVLTVGPTEYDARRFEELANQGREALAAGDLTRGGDALRQALALWRGPAFAGLREQSVFDGEAERLDELKLVVLERRVETDLAMGRHPDVIAELSGLVRQHPLRERFRAQLMLALYRSGRQADALEVYRKTRRVLIDELGLEPGPELRKLERAILDGGSCLALVAPSITASHAEEDRSKREVEAAGSEHRPPPHLLPADVADFSGREEECEFLRRELTPVGGTAVTVVLVVGRGGIGKTTLAVHLAHSMRETFPDGQLYVDLHGAEAHPADHTEVLVRFLRAIGMDDTTIPTGIDERAEIYRSRLAGRRYLVVLDDAADEAQVQALIPGSAGCGVLVTSRMRLTGLPGVRLLELDAFLPEKAVELLARIAGVDRVDAEPQAAQELVLLCGHLPLAVRIAGARLAARPHWTVSQMTHRLADQWHRLDELVHGHLDVRASLFLSYRGLDPQARRLFGLLGLLTAPDFASWVCAALLDTTIVRAEEILDRLVDAQLLGLSGPGDRAGLVRYHFHDLVCAYARERGETDEPAAGRVEALGRTFGAWLAHTEQAHIRNVGGNYLIVHGTAMRWNPDPAYVDHLVQDSMAWCEAESADRSRAGPPLPFSAKPRRP